MSTEHYTPREWQRIGTKFLIEHHRGELVADPGLGKTGMVLSALDLMKMGGSSFFPALVLAPKRVAEVVWDGERNKWDAFQDMSLIQIMGTRAERLAALKARKAEVYVTNYDNAPWLVEQFGGDRKQWPFKTVIADESSKLKGFRLSKGGVRATALSNIAHFTGRWWNLTGTPSPNGLQDLWGQYWFVDFGMRLKRTYGAYLEAYFMEDRYTRKVRTQHGCDEMIHEAIADVTLALRAVDWLDLTRPQEIPIEVQLPEKALASYRQMEKDYLLTLTDREIEAGTAAVKSTKCLQIASGSVWEGTQNPVTGRPGPGIEHPLHEAKIEGLQEIVEQSGGEPLLVCYWWKFDAERILRAFPQARVFQGPREQDEFNAGKIPMLLLQEQSAYGLNLAQSCRDIVFYSYFWNAELWQQFVERAGPVRQAQLGKKTVVRIWTIKARGTIEQEVLDSNCGKITIEQAFKRARARVRGV